MTSPTVFYCTVLALPLLAAGCGEGGQRESVDTFAAEVEARAGVPFAQEGAVVSLDVPGSVAAGGTVPIRLRVRNTTTAPLDLYLLFRVIVPLMSLSARILIGGSL